MLNANGYTTHRRGFLARLAAGSVALGLGAIPSPLRAASAEGAKGRVGGVTGPDEWLDGVKGKHRQVLDAVSVNNGMSLIWSMVFLNTHNQASELADKDLSAVTVLRHEAIPIAYTDPIWKKYKLGEAYHIMDPATKKPAERNPFFHPKKGELFLPGMEVETLLGRGVIFGVCNLATTVYSGMRADAIGVPKEEAYKEWVAALIPGMTLVPSGIWAVNNAQEHGCSYAYAG
ncbi:MAG TPA: twin-arginine translocation signal domain-containing protein [Gemmatimonadaceae bacterium]|nr:twin-arginine translocation signal domain-containing protein [Gemmatimonadaceae bacterium]